MRGFKEDDGDVIDFDNDGLPDAENVKFSKYIVEESRHMGDCSEVETLHLTK